MITSRLGEAIVDKYEEEVAAVALDSAFGRLPVVEPLHVKHAAAKRALDIVFAALFLTIALVPMLIVALLVKVSSRGPVFYSSERIGLGGKPFKFLKFRTMRVDADDHLHMLLEHNEKDGPIFKMEADPRVTPIGAFLRKYSLDEVPQMIHVLTGQMTLVGPRPPIRREVMLYDAECLSRLSVKPGLTCYWQVQGRSDLSFEKWMELDAKYLQDMSFWTDLKILSQTPIAVISGRGAY